MKIIFLTPEYPHGETGHAGGIGTSIRGLASALCELGHEVRVLVYGQVSDGEFTDGQVLIHKVRNVKLKGLSWYLTRKKLQRIINQLHSDGKADIVEAPDWTGITAFMNITCPVAVRLHGSDTYFCHIEGRKVKWFNRFLERNALKTADLHLSVSAFTAHLTNDLFGFSHPYHIVPNGVDGSRFVASPPGPDQVILYFGSLIRKKGVLELPLIFNYIHRQYPAARLLLAGKDVPDIQTGQPSTWQLMQPLFEPKAKQNVEYLGAIPYEMMGEVIGRAALCVFPSFAEAFPVSWIEAMASAKAIVASSIGWAPEVIDDGENGWLVHPQQHETYAERVVSILQNPALMRTFGDNAREKVLTQFDIRSIAKKNVTAYKTALDG